MDKDWMKPIPPAFDVQEPKSHKDEGELEKRRAEMDQQMEAHRGDALRLLGLNRKYEELTPDEKSAILKTPERIKAFDYIDTTTNPRLANRKKKRGIVSELLKKKIIQQQILKLPLVYLGSGTDVEYPLAMGARDIRMVDYIFSDERAQQEVLDRMRKILVCNVRIDGSTIKTQFDYGEGLEDVEIQLNAAAYNPGKELKAPAYEPPEQIGIVLEYASQGPLGKVVFEQNLLSKIADGGLIIQEDNVTKLSPDENEEFRLGEETKT